ncbi:MAG TPA: BTAD domain-containing putative transcriptional regulator [Actinoplanes sp.]|nr:BTAD domain-containing putative transcriptional regulator [Actinoplanes sp.]
MTALSAVLRIDSSVLLGTRVPAPAVRPPGSPRISLLGPLVVTRAGAPVALGRHRRRALLARLALTPGLPVGRDELIGLLWDTGVPDSAASVLHTYVSRLRRILGPDLTVDLTSAGYRLVAGADDLDLLDYQARVTGGRRLAPSDPHRAFDTLAGALDMWRGRHAAEDVPELHDDPRVVALTDEMLDTAIVFAGLGESLCRQPEVLPRLRRLAAQHPWHEALHARLVVALAACGQQSSALDAFDRVRRRLADDLGVDPGAELTAARQTVLERGWGSGRTAGTADLRTPPVAADFVGRSGELAVLVRALRSAPRRSPGQPGTVCLVSGAPGVGKSSLAARAAQSVRWDFPDGHFYLDLASPAPVARLLRGLGVPGAEITGDDQRDSALLRGLLSGRRVLLILDNARDAAQVEPLLTVSGGGAVLVTSRDGGAVRYPAVHVPLPVLTVPESVELLARHLGVPRVVGEFGTVTSLAEAGGGLPLVLRLIAGRVRAGRRAPREVLDDLAGAAVIDGSLRDLSPRAAEVFRAATVIPGDTFTAAVVAAVLGDDSGCDDHVLTELADEHLLQPVGPGRYRIDDLIRRHATAPSGEPAVLTRLADFYLAGATAVTRMAGADATAVTRMTGRLVAAPPAAGDPVGFPDVETALSWLDDEIRNIVALIEALSRHADGGRLAHRLRGCLRLARGHRPGVRGGRLR